MKDLKIYIIIATVLFVLYFMAQLNRPKVTNWDNTLQNNDKIPFGTYVLYNRITDILPQAKVTTYREPVYNVLTDHQVKNGTYLIIAKQVNLTEQDYDKLTQYIKAGNDVFIAASAFGPVLRKKLEIETNFDNNSNDEGIRIEFVNKNLNTYKYAIDHNCTNGYFNGFDTLKATVIGMNEFKHSNYISFTMGKGTLYLHSAPLMFTNYSLLQAQGAAYAPIALSYLKNNKTIIWDEYYSQGRVGQESSFRVFLNNPPLRNALYIAFFSLVIFVVYEMKRRQRIIPVIPPLNNATLEFVNVVGQVYYEQRNNSNIAQKKASYFLENLRTRYHIKTAVLNQEFVTLLSQKSGVTEGLIHQLSNQLIAVRNQNNVSDADLINLNKNIEQFYLQAR